MDYDSIMLHYPVSPNRYKLHHNLQERSGQWNCDVGCMHVYNSKLELHLAYENLLEKVDI